MNVCLSVPGPLGGQKREMAPVELDLAVFVNHHVVLGIQPKLCKQWVPSKPLSRASGS